MKKRKKIEMPQLGDNVIVTTLNDDVLGKKLTKYFGLVTDRGENYFFIGKEVGTRTRYFHIEHPELLEIELLNGESQKGKKMNKLTSWAKRILSEDEQSLYKAGLIDGDFAPTENGLDELNALVWAEKKEQLVKRAKEIIAENEAETTR